MCLFITCMRNRITSEIISNILLGRKYLIWVLVLLPPNFISGFKLHQNYTSSLNLLELLPLLNKITSFVSTSKIDIGYLTKFWYAINLEKRSLNLQKLIILIHHRNLSPKVKRTSKTNKEELHNKSSFNLFAYLKE